MISILRHSSSASAFKLFGLSAVTNYLQSNAKQYYVSPGGTTTTVVAVVVVALAATPTAAAAWGADLIRGDKKRS